MFIFSRNLTVRWLRFCVKPQNVVCNAPKNRKKMKKLLILTILLSIVSCKGQENESKELVKKANNFFMKSNLDEDAKIDSCLILINKAIEIDEDNFNAYYSKSKFLTFKKDIKELIKNNEKMIELRPNQPLWKMQRGLFFDIDGNKTEAEKNYRIGIAEYESLLKTELKNDFNLRMEYLSALETTGDIKKAEKELESISRDFPDNEILKVYKAEYKFKTKEQLIEIWKNGHE
jgi:tetratricopeptide (TPR) repeat protein